MVASRPCYSGSYLESILWCSTLLMPLVRPSLSGQTLLPSFYALRQIQDKLPEEEAFRFSQDVNETTTNLLINSQKQKEVAEIPIQNPDSVRYKFFKKKGGAQSGQNERRLTTNELAKANNKNAQQLRSRSRRTPSFCELDHRNPEFRLQT